MMKLSKVVVFVDDNGLDVQDVLTGAAALRIEIDALSEPSRDKRESGLNYVDRSLSKNER